MIETRLYPISKMALRTSSVLVFGAWAVLILDSCKNDLPPAKYVKAYEDEALSERIIGGYRFSLMLMSPDYLLAGQVDSTWSESEVIDFRKSLRNSYYLSLRISPVGLSGGPDDLEKDFLGKAMIEGQSAYAEKLHFLQNELGAYASVELSNGERINPKSYRFERGYGLGGAQSFLFLFPKSMNAKEFTIQGCRFVLRDFGLNTGTLTIPIRTASSMALKV